MVAQWISNGQKMVMTENCILFRHVLRQCAAVKMCSLLSGYHLKTKGQVLIEGRAIGHKVGTGTAKVLASLDEMDQIQPGDVFSHRHDRSGLGTHHENVPAPLSRTEVVELVMQQLSLVN